ncbi:ead/Ea22-like family protein [Klebsiella aerogenes]
MTDITELALLVSKAKASVFTLEYISQFEPADIDSDDVDLRFEVDDMDVGTNVSIVDECGQAAKVIGALVEALEKAQQQNISDFEIKARLCKESNSLHDRLREAEKRIAELESRTVKLPAACADDEYFNDGVFQPMRYERDVERAIRAAGIKWEAE